MTSKQVDQFDIDTILQSYLFTALWTEEKESDFDTSDFDPETVEKSKKEIRAFLLLAPKDTGSISADQIGHDLWLTRNGHGAGFWDRGTEKLGDDLTEICKQLPHISHLFDQDGKVFIE